MTDALKYQKKNWIKLKVQLFEYGLNERNWGYVIVYFKKTKMLYLQCHPAKVDEFKKIKLGTALNIWLTIESKVHNQKYYTNGTLMHHEEWKSIEQKLKAEHDYKNGINKISDNELFGKQD